MPIQHKENELSFDQGATKKRAVIRLKRYKKRVVILSRTQFAEESQLHPHHRACPATALRGIGTNRPPMKPNRLSRIQLESGILSMTYPGFAPLMDEFAQLATLPPSGDPDPVPQTLLAAFPEQARTLGLLYDVSRELTSILDREELLRRIAERVKKIVNYDVFTVMLWNEKTELLEGVFAMHYENSIPARFRVPLNQGVT